MQKVVMFNHSSHIALYKCYFFAAAMLLLGMKEMTERIQGINWGRIQWCCEQEGLGVEQLAQGANVSVNTLERVRDRGDGLTYLQLQRIAAFFGRGVLFFLENDAVTEGEQHSADFRTLANQKHDMGQGVRRLIQRAEWQRDAYVGLLEDLDDQDVVRFVMPDVPRGNPIQAAAFVRAWLGLTIENDFQDFRRKIEDKGVLVFRTNGYNGKWQVPSASNVLGFSIYHESFPTIVVRKDDSPARQNFTLFHELAHILLHRESVIDDDFDYFSHAIREREANCFAGHILVTDQILGQINTGNWPVDPAGIDEHLAQVKAVTGASVDVILLRLIEAGRIDRSVYANYREWIRRRPVVTRDSGGSRMYRHREPRHILGDRYVRVVLEALNEKRISLTKASKFLDGLKVQDLQKLGDYCANA